jgi:hypothetical protein
MDLIDFMAPKILDRVLLELHAVLEQLNQAIRDLELERSAGALSMAPISHPHCKHHWAVRHSRRQRAPSRQPVFGTQ